MYRLIACDLDETLIGKDRTICEDNIRMIRKAKEAGVRFVPATGRGYTTVSGTLEELGLYDLPDQYVISFNGGVLTENKGSRIIYRKGMSFETASELFERSKDLDCAVRVYTIDKIYVFRITEEERRFSGTRNPVIECEGTDLQFLKDTPLMKLIYVNADFSYLKQIENEVLSDLADRLDIGYSSGRYMELNPKGVNKGTGLAKLAEYLNIPMEETIAVGDNYNDLPMIQAAGLGIGTANTIESMKPLCDLITEKSCEEGAVAEVIERFVLENRG